MINVIPTSTEHTITKKNTPIKQKRKVTMEDSFTLFLAAVVVALLSSLSKNKTLNHNRIKYIIMTNPLFNKK